MDKESVIDNGVTYSAIRPRATEALLAAVVCAGFTVDGTVVLVYEVHPGWVGKGGCHEEQLLGDVCSRV